MRKKSLGQIIGAAGGGKMTIPWHRLYRGDAGTSYPIHPGAQRAGASITDPYAPLSDTD
ncbi:hypothetical protein GCM10027430_30910 [Lysobacter tyrosinilyticus]